MIRASIDLGTQTCLMLVAEWRMGEDEPKRILGDFSKVVRLGEGVDRTRELAPAAMGRASAALAEYASQLRQMGGVPKKAVCVATSQARDARNGADFFKHVEAETGFCFRTLSGDEEARFSFEGALLPGMDRSLAAVIDIGGGSTELISTGGGQSIDVGAVRFTERYLKSNPVSDQEFWQCIEAVDQVLIKTHHWREELRPDIELVAVAGTATTLAAWHLGLDRFDSARVSGTILERGDVHRMLEELKWRTIEERKMLPSMEPGRADVILAGAVILWRALELLNFAQVKVSCRGLRYGVLKAGLDEVPPKFAS